MRKKIHNILSTIIFLLLLNLFIFRATDILSAKNSVIKYHDMEKDEFDVLFFGSSHVINAVFPMELWNEYGIVSYNCGGHGNTLPTTYWMLKNVLNQKKPEVVVIDVLGVEWNNRRRPERQGVYQQHTSFDWQPMTKEKLGMMDFLLDTIEEKMEFIAPITLYHDRWKELSREDFEIPYGKEKGAEYRSKRTVPNDFKLVSEDEMFQEDTLGKQYLCKMIKECQERGIKVLLIQIPYPANEESQKWGNSVELIAKEYAVPYLNMFYEDVGVNFFTDCFDADSHLNPSGARKVSKFLGKYLQDNYLVLDRRGDALYESWEEDYAEYKGMKWEILKDAQKDPWTYLSLLQDENLDVCLFFSGESEMIYWGTPPKLVENIAELNCLQKASGEQKDYFMVADREQGIVTEYIDLKSNSEIETSFGNIRYTSRNENGVCGLFINGREENYLLNSDGTMADIAAISFDRATGEMVDWVRFNSKQSMDVIAR